ncbi:MAG: peptide ABC transporter substrate-binding protein [SAR202 cluster bacterium]|nr:peptide ABC transporter substrate-binding protein [SAR202 cluster bacterium]
MLQKLRLTGWVALAGLMFVLVSTACSKTETVTVTVERTVISTVPVTVEVERTVVVTPTPGPRALGKVAYLNLGVEPPTLDPALAADNISGNIIENVFVGLTNLNTETSEVEPDLAARWDVSADGTVYTFHLRNDVKWTDGRPVTAHDAEYGILRSLAPETGSQYAFLIVSIIRNAAAFNAGEISDASQVGVRALDDYTLEITLEHAAAYFPALASTWVMFPQPRWAIEAHGDKWIEPENIVCNGPYKVLSWVHGSSLVLVKNPTYYNPGRVAIETLDFKMVENPATALALYEAGALDSVNPPPEELDRIRSSPTLSAELSISPSLSTYSYGFTVDRAPMDNVLVRKAFAAAVDKQSLVDFVLKGGQRPARTFTPPGNFGAVDGAAENVGIAFDPAQARQWLAEAGYPNGQGFPSVTLMFPVGDIHQPLAEAIAAMWKANLNVDVTLAAQDFGVFISTLFTDPTHMWLIVYGSDYPDADNWLRGVFHSQAPINFARFNNAEFDEAVDQAAREQDIATRKSLYKRAEQILTQDVAAIMPIYYLTEVALEKPYLDRTYSPFGGEQYYTWKVFEH